MEDQLGILKQNVFFLFFLFSFFFWGGGSLLLAGHICFEKAFASNIHLIEAAKKNVQLSGAWLHQSLFTTVNCITTGMSIRKKYLSEQCQINVNNYTSLLTELVQADN